MARPFWLTGTIVVTLKGLFKNKERVTHALLSEALEICCDSWFGKHLFTDVMKVGTIVPSTKTQLQKNFQKKIT